MGNLDGLDLSWLRARIVMAQFGTLLKNPNKVEVMPGVALLQRAIPHYRAPLFKKLATQTPFDWTFYCARHAQSASTGLPATDLDGLRTCPTLNRQLFGSFVYQSGVRLGAGNLAAFMLDLGWNLASTPRYLVEARMRGIATIGWSKGIPQEPDKPESEAKRLYQRLILKMCDVLVVYGKISRDYFLAAGFPERRIFVAQNTVDTARIADELPNALAQREILLHRLPVGGRFVFGYMGGLVPRKKVESIIEAFNRVRSSGLDAVLMLGSSGDLMADMGGGDVADCGG